MVEGDDFHPASNVAKMRSGTPLSDDDRAAWLDTLAAQLQAHPGGVVLTCSALKRRYRDRLRAGDLIATGTPREVFENPRVLAAYFEEPAHG